MKRRRFCWVIKARRLHADSPPPELVAREGVYQNLYNEQFKSAQEESLAPCWVDHLGQPQYRQIPSDLNRP